MENKSMKLITLTIFCSCFLLLASLVNGENKSIDKDNFMRINPNITNDVLRSELENLVKEFDVERQRVRNSYDKKIETLRDERRIEIKSIKNEFREKRKALFIKYGEDIKKTKPAINPNMEKREKYGEDIKKTKPAINPNMEKREKGKKPLRKSK